MSPDGPIGDLPDPELNAHVLQAAQWFILATTRYTENDHLIAVFHTADGRRWQITVQPVVFGPGDLQIPDRPLFSLN